MVGCRLIAELTHGDKNSAEYNGPHVCPRCGSQSQWKVADPWRDMIHVQCAGDCGDYTMSYGQLRTYPYFKRTPPASFASREIKTPE